MLRRLQDTYHAFSRPFWTIAFGALVSSAGSSLIWPFQFIYITRTLGLNLATVGTLITLSSGTGLAVSFLAGTMADRFGRKPVMIAAQAAQGCAWILMSFAHTYLGFLVALMILASSQPVYSVGSDAMMADLVPPEQRASGYAIMRVLNNVGIALGPAVGGIIVTRSYALAFYGAAAVLFLYGLFLQGFVRETLPRRDATGQGAAASDPGGYRQVARDRGFLLFTLLITLGMTGPLMFWTLMPIYTKQNFQFPEHLYSWLPVTNALMCVFVQYFVTRWTRRYAPLAMLILGLGVYTLGVGSVALMSGFWGFWTSMVIFSLGELITMPTGTTYVANRAPVVLRGRYMSVYWLTWGCARAVAPMIGGTLNDLISPHAIWYGGLAIGLASALALTWFRASRAQVRVPEVAPATGAAAT